MLTYHLGQSLSFSSDGCSLLLTWLAVSKMFVSMKILEFFARVQLTPAVNAEVSNRRQIQELES